MDDSAEDVIGGELDPSEQLLWAGRPRQGLVLHVADVFLIPFSIMWAGFAVFWEATVWFSGAPLIFRLWGIPFILVGAYITVGRFLVDARQRAATVYGVTSERVLIVSGVLSRRVKSLNIDTLTDVALVERWGGGGTITFGSVPFPYSLYARGGWPGFRPYVIPTFDLAAGAREVYDLIRDAQRRAKQRS